MSHYDEDFLHRPVLTCPYLSSLSSLQAPRASACTCSCVWRRELNSFLVSSLSLTRSFNLDLARFTYTMLTVWHWHHRYVNNYVNIDKLRAVGFDYDYTLVQYVTLITHSRRFW